MAEKFPDVDLATVKKIFLPVGGMAHMKIVHTMAKEEFPGWVCCFVFVYTLVTTFVTLITGNTGYPIQRYCYIARSCIF